MIKPIGLNNRHLIFMDEFIIHAIEYNYCSNKYGHLGAMVEIQNRSREFVNAIEIVREVSAGLTNAIEIIEKALLVGLTIAILSYFFKKNNS